MSCPTLRPAPGPPLLSCGYSAGFRAAWRRLVLRLRPAGAALVLAACHPAAPPVAAPPVPRPPAARPATRAALAETAATALPAPAADTAAPPVATLRLPGGQAATLHPATAAAFARLDATRSVPEAGPDNDTADQPLPERVRRVGPRLLLSPEAGPVVALLSDTGAGAARPRRYQYWGSLPGAHQWAILRIEADKWLSANTLLIDQRTGRRVEVRGCPVASPKGSFILVTPSSILAAERSNGLALVQVDATGPRLLWQRQPGQLRPVQARWAGPGRWLLQVFVPEPGGDAPKYRYLELRLPEPPATAAAAPAGPR